MRSADEKFPEDLIDSLVTALLAVNNYSLEKAWEVLPRVRGEGLTKPGQSRLKILVGWLFVWRKRATIVGV